MYSLLRMEGCGPPGGANIWFLFISLINLKDIQQQSCTECTLLSNTSSTYEENIMQFLVRSGDMHPKM